MIHIYTGNGKGKTTAALGLALRAFGSGKNIVAVQFLKGSQSAEVEMLRNIGITILRNREDYGFFSFADEQTKARIKSENSENLYNALRLIKDGGMLILDEVIPAYNLNAIDRDVLDALITNPPASTELILTGMEPPPHFIEAADYVSDIRKLKHPFDRGQQARKGIEY